MDVFENRYFKINKIALCVIGQWVYQTFAMKTLSRTLIFMSLATAAIPQFNFLFSVVGDTDAFIECVTPLFLVILSCCQIIIFILKQDKLQILVKHIENDWTIRGSEGERKILEKHANEGRLYTLLYAMNMYGSAMIFILMSMVPIALDHLLPLNETRPRQLVYAAKFPVDENKYLTWILIHGSITASYNVTVLFSCESMLAVTTKHVCGLFAIASHKMKSAMKLKNTKDRTKSGDESYKNLTSGIKWHNHAIAYAEVLDSCFSPFLLCTMAVNVMIVSCLLIQTLNSLESLNKTVKYGIFASCCMIHLFCLALPAQDLLDNSLEVSHETCDGEWYNMPVKAQKLIAPIILRGQVPSTLTVGKFCNMDMVAFAVLLKTSISYFTVLLSMR